MKRTISLVLVVVLGLVGEVANANFTFSEPVNLGVPINSAAIDYGANPSADGLSLYFCSNRDGSYGDGAADLWVATRPMINDPWQTPENLGPVINSSAWDSGPSISTDDLSLFFESNRSGIWDIWVTTRETKDADWGEPLNLGPTFNSPTPDLGPSISAEGLSLLFDSGREGGYGMGDIWIATRATIDEPWEQPINLGLPVNTSDFDVQASMASDGLALFFSSNRSGNIDLWYTTRTNVSGPWDPPINLGDTVNSSVAENYPKISADGKTLYFSTEELPGGLGSNDQWQVSIEPVVDLNGDGIVDAADMCLIVDHWYEEYFWGEEYFLYDIGPMPWGDGIVDVQDLVVLADHLFEEVNDSTLVSHWALDETEGMTAHDSVSGNNDFVMGGALWQPAVGKVNGAIELDGIDDSIITSTLLSPTEESFSIVAWIKGGKPGQVIISQPNGSDWLVMDAEGKLMTELNGLDQSATALFSQAFIADEQWHRIGLVWDGSRRMLFVDGVTVAEDTQDGLGFSSSGLYIGVGKNYTSGTFFSGLIDDVRIYNRVLCP